MRDNAQLFILDSVLRCNAQFILIISWCACLLSGIPILIEFKQCNKYTHSRHMSEINCICMACIYVCCFVDRNDWNTNKFDSGSQSKRNTAGNERERRRDASSTRNEQQCMFNNRLCAAAFIRRGNMPYDSYRKKLIFLCSVWPYNRTHRHNGPQMHGCVCV